MKAVYSVFTKMTLRLVNLEITFMCASHSLYALITNQ